MMKKNVILCIVMGLFFMEAVSQEKKFPAITLSNAIYYTDTSFTDLPGNGFLLDIGDEILAVTCKHALWTSSLPGMQVVDFEDKLEEWKMQVLNDTKQYVKLGELINANDKEKIGEGNTSNDFLVFEVKRNHSEITPLKLSLEYAKPGDTLYQKGWTFKNKHSEPKAIVATVERYHGSALYVQGLLQQNNAGLSGSPVVNKDMELTGIVSSWKYDNREGKWFEAPGSIDYLWQVLYDYWLSKNHQGKSLQTFNAFLEHCENYRDRKPEISSYLLTELFYNDWLKDKGMEYASIESFYQWGKLVLKELGIIVIADDYRKSLLVFDEWKKGYENGELLMTDLEKNLEAEGAVLPDFSAFCLYSEVLARKGEYKKALELLDFIDGKIQHMGQLYAYKGDVYFFQGNLEMAEKMYRQCLKTYPEYPVAVKGLYRLAKKE